MSDTNAEDGKFLKVMSIFLWISLVVAFILAYLQTYWAMGDTIIDHYTWFFVAAFIILYLYKRLQKSGQELNLFDRILIYVTAIILTGQLVSDAKALYTIRKYQGRSPSDNIKKLDSDLIDLKAHINNLHQKDPNIPEIK